MPLLADRWFPGNRPSGINVFQGPEDLLGLDPRPVALDPRP